MLYCSCDFNLDLITLLYELELRILKMNLHTKINSLVVVVYLFQQANETCNNNIISFTKLGNQKGKCPSCWPPIAQTKY